MLRLIELVFPFSRTCARKWWILDERRPKCLTQGIVMAAATPFSDDWLTLPDVAREMGVSRSAVYLWVTSHRLDAMQCGPRWLVRRSDLESFRQRHQLASSAGREYGPRNGDTAGPALVLELLDEWGEARVDELAEVLQRHPGNVRKYLRLLESRKHVARGEDGHWRRIALR